jgi:hypothetical protein
MDDDFGPTALGSAYEGMTNEEAAEDIQRRLDKFVEMGVCEAKIMEDGERGYRLTDLGRAYYESMQIGAMLN